ncbi:YciI-like protein [Paraburkholderia kururiensis]|uniref:YciI-like protein n=1 Tax=Paraburkholderia kururiensis TaxID=984307 RepID=UPI0005AA63AE|nr:YciI-like protein [Paraburkholderia kururiensis]
MHYLLMYDVAPDYLQRRGEYRAAHLALAWAAASRGELLLAGALTDPVDGAVLLFTGETSAVAEDFARADPYVREGLVTRWHVRGWQTVVGEQAATPVRAQ